MIPLEILKAVTGLWGIPLRTVRQDLPLSGSPERSLFRVAFEGTAGRPFVLEQIAAPQRKRKSFIHSILDQLHRDGLDQVNPFLKTSSGESTVFYGGAWWQLSNFIEGQPLSRPGYIRNGAKGKALARFLCSLSTHSKSFSHESAMTRFSIKDYILRLEKDMMEHDPDVASRFIPIIDLLRGPFLRAHDTVPMVFCHGDYHPLNIIWQDNRILSVIDWEFCGLKPELYDAANLVGCIGMEHPSGLTDDLVISFIDYMRRVSGISSRTWSLFPMFVIALRFAWLAEWLRNRDKEMIDLEEIYMNILYENREKFAATWGLK